MSKIFNVDEERINPKNRLWTLDTDLVRGLKRAVNNNQQQLALQYLSHIVQVLDETLASTPAQESVAKSNQDTPAVKRGRAYKAAATTPDTDGESEDS